MLTETIDVTPSWHSFSMILGMYLQNHMPAKQQATLHDMLAEAQKMAKLADQWVEHCKVEKAKVSRDTPEVLTNVSKEERYAKIQADHATRRNEWVRDPDGGAEYLRLALLHILLRHSIEDIILFDEEGEAERFRVGQANIIPSETMDNLIGYLYDIDGPVAFKLTREGQSPYVLHCLHDCSNDPDEIIFDYHVSQAVDDALNFASRQHPTTRSYYNNDQEG